MPEPGSNNERSRETILDDPLPLLGSQRHKRASGPARWISTSMFAAVCLLCVLLVFSRVVYGDRIDLFVLAGQSNMQGWQGDARLYPPDPGGLDQRVKFYWMSPGITDSNEEWTFMQAQGGRFADGHFGPEVTFSRLLAQEGQNVAVFKYSLGCTSLAEHWKKPGDNGMYDQMVTELASAVSMLRNGGNTVVFRALVWIQGEADAANKDMAHDYGDRLRLLVDHFRRNVAKDAALPILLGLDEQHDFVRRFPEVVAAQQRLASEGRNILFISMVGLEKADTTHLTPRGLQEHGQRLFEAYKKVTLSAENRKGASRDPGVPVTGASATPRR